MKLAEWGSGLASNLWSPFVTSLYKKNDIIVSGSIPSAAQSVAGVLVSEFCRARYNDIKTTSYSGDDSIKPIYRVQAGKRGATVSYYYTQDVTQDGKENLTAAYCGITLYDQPGGVTTFVQTLLTGYENAYDTMVSEVETLAQTLNGEDYCGDIGYPCVGNEDNLAKMLNDEGTSGSLRQIIRDYQDNLKLAAENAQVKANSTAEMDSIKTEVTEAGWAAAPLWFNTVARMNSEYMTALRALPYSIPPDYSSSMDPSTNSQAATIEQRVRKGVDALQLALKGTLANTQTTTFGYDYPTSGVGTPSVAAGLGGADNNWKTDKEVANAASRAIATELTEIFSTNLLGGPFGHIGVGADAKISAVYPLADLAAIGDWLIDRSFALYGASLMPGLKLLSFFAMIGFGMGVTLLYLLPILPFIRFMFGIVGWLLNILEAIVAIPLIALAHLATGGGGISGDMARQGYFMIFSLFLRPALMIVGLIIGLLMFSVSIEILNSMYKYALLGFHGTAQVEHPGGLSVFVYTLIYVLIAYAACNMCFQMIEDVPDHIFKWANMANAGRATSADDKVVQSLGGISDNVVMANIARGGGELKGFIMKKKE